MAVQSIPVKKGAIRGNSLTRVCDPIRLPAGSYQFRARCRSSTSATLTLRFRQTPGGSDVATLTTTSTTADTAIGPTGTVVFGAETWIYVFADSSVVNGAGQINAVSVESV